MGVERWINGQPKIVFGADAQDVYGFGMGMLFLAATADLVNRQVIDKKHTPKRTLPSRVFELFLFGGLSYVSVRALRQGLTVKMGK